MTHSLRCLCAPLALGLFVAAAPAIAQKSAPVAKPDLYLCPNATGGGVDCFLHAVEHLYTMCRQVKSIEIIEFGYEQSTDGVNGAKSESCIEKHRQSIARPYQSALREANASRPAVEGLKSLHGLWVTSLAELKWKTGESDPEYATRVAQPYALFAERATAIRAALPSSKGKSVTAPKPPTPSKRAS